MSTLSGRCRTLLAVALGLALAEPASAQAVGRLFSTVEDRLRLDEIRESFEYGKPPKPPEPVRAARAEPDDRPVVPQVTINGVVLRSSGNDASWINGTSILSGQVTAEGIRVEPGRRGGSGSVRLVLPSGIDTAPIKPGQRIDVVSGSVVDTYRAEQEGTAVGEAPAGSSVFGTEKRSAGNADSVSAEKRE